MTFKSDKQPLCRYCGRPIAKRTIYLAFGYLMARNGRMTEAYREARLKQEEV